jgi:hypothetical protein
VGYWFFVGLCVVFFFTFFSPSLITCSKYSGDIH